MKDKDCEYVNNLMSVQVKFCCQMSEENISKLWKYTNKKKTECIEFPEFTNFAVYLIHSFLNLISVTC